MFVVPVLAGQTKPNVRLIKGDNKVDIMIGSKILQKINWQKFILLLIIYSSESA